MRIPRSPYPARSPVRPSVSAVLLVALLAGSAAPAGEPGKDPGGSSLETLKKYYRDEIELGKTTGEVCDEVCRLYKALSQEEAGALLRWTFEAAPDSATSVLSSLSCLRREGLRGHHESLLSRRIFFPASLYRNADEKTRDALIALAESTDKTNNHVFWSLAWIQDEVVRSKFREWEAKPGEQRQKGWSRYYTEDAGWILRDDGSKMLLYRETCIPLVDRKRADADPSVCKTIVPLKEKCRWCGNSLCSLFELDLKHERLKFLGIDGTLLRIPTCESCGMWEEIQFQTDGEGGFAWHEKNKKELETDQEALKGKIIRIPSMRLAASKSVREPFEAADEFCPARPSQIGGLPTWIQSYDYPRCLSCGKIMAFIAQYSLDDLDDAIALEGIFYAFYCKDCRVACASHQQS